MAAFLAYLGLVGRLDFDSAVVIEKMVQESPRPYFEHPLPWTATVTQSGPGIREVRTRYYVPKGNQ